MSEAAGQISEPYQSVHSLLSLLLQESSLHFRNLNMISEDHVKMSCVGLYNHLDDGLERHTRQIFTAELLKL